MSLVLGVPLAVIGSLAFGLMLFDALRPRALRDKPPRFLDEHQVRHALTVADERALARWVAELVEDTHAVEADRATKRAAGLCSCTPDDDDLPHPHPIADRRCVHHGAFHD